MTKEWIDNDLSPITKQCTGKTLLIRFKSKYDGISHTDEEEGIDYTVDLTWIRDNDGTIAATTGKYTNKDIRSWKEI